MTKHFSGSEHCVDSAIESALSANVSKRCVSCSALAVHQAIEVTDHRLPTAHGCAGAGAVAIAVSSLSTLLEMKLLLLALLSRSLASPLGIRHGQIAHQTLESDAIGNHGAVSCELEVCSDAGVEILKAGGSSADAVIAAAHCVDVINGFHSGLGGGGFSVVRDANGSVETIDFRETCALANRRADSQDACRWQRDDVLGQS